MEGRQIERGRKRARKERKKRVRDGRKRKRKLLTFWKEERRRK